MNRPKNLTIIVYLQSFFCSFLLTCYLAILLVEPVTLRIVEIVVPSSLDNNFAEAQAYHLISFFSMLSIILSLIGLLLVYGLLKRKILAWILTLLSQILEIFTNLIFLFYYYIYRFTLDIPKFYFLIGIFHLIVACATIYYLFERDVIKAFFNKLSS